MSHAFSQRAEHSDYLLTFKENRTITAVKTFQHSILGIKVLDVLLKGWLYFLFSGGWGDEGFPESPEWLLEASG